MAVAFGAELTTAPAIAQYLTAEDVARSLRVSVRTARRKMSTMIGAIDCGSGRKILRVPVAAFERWCANRAVECRAPEDSGKSAVEAARSTTAVIRPLDVNSRRDATISSGRDYSSSASNEKPPIRPIQQSWGEREGQAPRCMDIDAPIGTLVAGGIKHALVGAFLAKHFGERDGGWNGGSDVRRPVGTITTRDHNSLVASSLVKFRGECNGAPMGGPMPTITAGGTHLAEVRAFLQRHNGSDNARVMVRGEQYEIADLGMRMLVPRELFRAQGFPDRYRIDLGHGGKPLTKTAQVRLVGNSVCPPIAAALVRANCADVAQRREVA